MKKYFLFLIILLIIFVFWSTGKVEAGATDNVSGWAWSENIGWISFNRINCDPDDNGFSNGLGDCPSSGTSIPNYGVKIDGSTRIFSGYAWSENIGWISFNQADLAGCPSGTCQAELDFVTYEVSGWAKALTNGGGWDGWIKLRGWTTEAIPREYGVSWNSSTQEMEGWAWSDMVIGWISFNCNNPESGDVCLTSDYKVVAALGNIPDTIIDSGPSSPTNETSATFTFSGTESPTSFQCKLDTGSFSVCTSPKIYTVLQGSHTFEVKAINVLGEDPTPASWNWLVDTTDPQVTAFNVNPSSPNWVNNPSPDVDISWTVTDSGGSYLSHVEVWRMPDGGGWEKIGSDYPAPPDSNSWSSSASNSPPHGTWWYGLHVLDKAGNMGTESASIKVLVDKMNPTTSVTDPAGGSWFNDDFLATMNDSDIGSGLTPNCEYLIVGLDPDPLGTDCSSGILSRNCDPVIKNIPVGPGACTVANICLFEGKNRCRVNTKSFDIAGNTSGWRSESFNIDFTEPAVGEISPLTAQQGIEETFIASLRDDVGKIAVCWLYVNGSYKDTNPCTGEALTMTMVVDPIPCENGADCTVSVNYCFDTFGSHQMQFRCRDSAGNEGQGDEVTVTVGENHSPVITAGPGYTTSPCASPTTQVGCMVNFTVGAFDPDGDPLFWDWDFGDGNTSTEQNPSYHYNAPSPDPPGYYTVTVIVSDGRGGETSGSVDLTVTDATLAIVLCAGLDAATLCADPYPGAAPLNGVDLKATVSGTTYGNINYKFDCQIEDGDCMADGDYSDCDLQADGQTTETFTAINLCDYPAAGTYTAKVFIQRETENREDTATINVIENQAPIAGMSGDASLCSGGEGNGNWIAYRPTADPPYTCVYTINNDSTDPNGIDDIIKSDWYLKKQGEPDSAYVLKLSCGILCNYTLQLDVEKGDYVVKLYVEDQWGASDNTTHLLTVRKEVTARFMCSLDNANWQDCSIISLTENEVLYFKDELSETQHSDPSDGASSIVSRLWEKGDGVTFGVFASDITNPSTTIIRSSNVIRLTVTDDNPGGGRSDYEEHTIFTTLPLPEWREIPPF